MTCNPPKDDDSAIEAYDKDGNHVKTGVDDCFNCAFDDLFDDIGTEFNKDRNTCTYYIGVLDKNGEFIDQSGPISYNELRTKRGI